MMPDRTPMAELNDEQLKMLSEMEDELGVTLVAYESSMHETNHIVESDV
ncbi:hypothetical protein QWT69_16325 [Sporosarcina oncorhynchi]|uniref:Uncharacterized protein n=1 Tax=Sporosarcina oncorhynchi TaxID=3056444 RepID=A0ABZ0L7M8_9BACL|nr:hypothetical protein [Sporosarcina sp. T2O-4]WOV87394.1 hypothetical protein QWT69_16325 [Sporosarcina sp. T2O-4]